MQSKYFFKKYRSSRPKVFCKISVLRNFTKFRGKHLCQSLFFNKVAGQRRSPEKKRWFSVNFEKFWRTSFLQNTSRRLLLLIFSLGLVIKLQRMSRFNFRYILFVFSFYLPISKFMFWKLKLLVKPELHQKLCLLCFLAYRLHKSSEHITKKWCEFHT